MADFVAKHLCESSEVAHGCGGVFEHNVAGDGLVEFPASDVAAQAPAACAGGRGVVGASTDTENAAGGDLAIQIVQLNAQLASHSPEHRRRTFQNSEVPQT